MYGLMWEDAAHIHVSFAVILSGKLGMGCNFNVMFIYFLGCDVFQYFTSGHWEDIEVCCPIRLAFYGLQHAD